jgi:sulfite reductase beta subunit-like hemoprotein
MSATDDTTTLGATRLRFSDEKDVDLFVERLERFERGEIGPDDWRSFRLLNGVYGQRQDGQMMVRVKLPGGLAGPVQLNALAEVAEGFAAEGNGHVTTRQNVQFHFVDQARVEPALRLLAAAGLTTREACGHSVRNFTLCPYAGISEHEPFDPTPYAEALVRHFLRGPWSSSLPRKFKPAVGGCCGGDCVLGHINDLAFLARVEDGVRGFKVVAGGGLSTLRRSAVTVYEFCPAAEILEAGEAVVRVFHRIGNRHNKAKARLKWAIDKVGLPTFLAEIAAERELIRGEGGRPLVLPEVPAPPTLRAPLPQLAEPLPGFEAFVRTNVRGQKQRGFSAVTIRLILGDLSAAQLRGLAVLAETHGEGELRATTTQNFLLRYVPTWRLPLVHRDLVELGLAERNADTVADVVSCPGAWSCKLAVTQSRGLAQLLGEFLGGRPDLVAAAPDLTIKASGCPNSCGQHHIAGLGFQGGVRKVDGKAVPQYHLHVGGSVGEGGAVFGRLVAKIPARKTPQAVERLITLYAAEKQHGESPAAFFARAPKDRLLAALGDAVELKEPSASDFVDLGETTAFSVMEGEGECAA